MADGQEGPDYWPIVEDIRRQISDGNLERGQKLPSLPQLQLTYGKTEGIVRRALAELRVEGLISSHQGKGYFVRADAEPNSEFQQLTQMLNETQEKLEQLTRRVEELEQNRQRQSETPARPTGQSGQ